MSHVLLLGVLLAAGCESPATKSGLTSDSGPHRNWVYTGNALIHAPSESDNFDIVLRCVEEPPRTEVSVGEDSRLAETIVLRSGRRARAYSLDREASDLASFATARIAANDPVLQAFRRTGEIAREGWLASSANTRAEREAIRAFFASCR